MWIGALIVGAFLALAFAGSGGAKLAGVAAMRESARHLGFSFWTYRTIGLLEGLGALGLIVGLWRGQPTAVFLGIAAAAGLAILMLGAFASHLRARDPLAQACPPLVLALLSATYISLLIHSA